MLPKVNEYICSEAKISRSVVGKWTAWKLSKTSERGLWLKKENLPGVYCNFVTIPETNASFSGKNNGSWEYFDNNGKEIV